LCSMSNLINFNGNLVPKDQPVFTASSRAARYGDALFETMRMLNGKILFEEMHADRLFNGFLLLHFILPEHFNWQFLKKEIEKLISKVPQGTHRRIRLTVSRGDGGISEEPAKSPQFMIESWLIEEYSYNTEGFVVDVFDPIRKSTDSYSNLKSANYLPSVMSAIFAKENRLDECLLLNSNQRICDATISNVFWTKDQTVFTPPLKEGGIAGVMRNYLLRKLPDAGYLVAEKNVDTNTLLQADEIFFTNVIRGISWVKTFRNTEFTNQFSSAFFKKFISPLMLVEQPS